MRERDNNHNDGKTCHRWKIQPPAQYYHSTFRVDKAQKRGVKISILNDGSCHGRDTGINLPPGEKAVYLKNAIFIYGIGWQNYYHFITEYLTHMYDIQDIDLNEYTIIIPGGHPGGAGWARRNFIAQWLDIIQPGLSKNIKYIPRGDDIHVDHAIFIGRGIGGPHRLQQSGRTVKEMNWLKAQVDVVINTNRQDLLVLFKRSTTRRCMNWQEVYNICNEHASRLGLQLHVIDDNNLPSVVDQLSILSRAKIVTGMHGAGYTNIIACKPNTHIIEHLCRKGKATNPDCYDYLSKSFQLHYHPIHVERTEFKNRADGLVDTKQFVEVLENILL